METYVSWLISAAQPWVEYRARIDLLGQSEDDAAVRAARAAMLAHPQVQALAAEVAEWPGPVLKRHNDAGHPLHKLAFLADMGLRADDSIMAPIVGAVLSRQSPEGPFTVIEEIAVAFGGDGLPRPLWILCDAPTVAAALATMGLAGDERVQAATAALAGLMRGDGWPCAGSPDLGSFRGPGRKSAPCPYATLIMLKLMASMPAWRDSAQAHAGAEAMLSLWQARRERRPYLFAMGTDFAKLKAPLVWYDIVHVLDVLTRFPWLLPDWRLREMASIVAAKADARGRFTPESVYRAWAGWDVGQKKEPSPWLTLVVQRALRRLGAEPGG